MKAPAVNYFRSTARRRAFSLLELLVAVGLLGLIVLALYAMFDQTQRALHASIGQVDVMEGGRSAMDLIARDLARAQSPSLPATMGSPSVTNINLAIRKRNFARPAGGIFQPPGVDDTLHRDVPLNELYFQTQLQGNRWTAVGFFVAGSAGANLLPDETLGTLYRYQDPLTEAPRGTDAARRFSWFYSYNGAANKNVAGNQRSRQKEGFIEESYRRTNSTRLIDNVLFFRVLPFASSGIPVDVNLATDPKYFGFFTNASAAGIMLTNLVSEPPDIKTTTTFVNNAMPAAVEVELGVLSPRLWTQYTNQANSELKVNFLAKHSADILIFRQRIPLRTALQ